MKLIFKKLKKKRLELGMSQAEFAKKINVHFRTLQDYELGKGSPTSAGMQYLKHLMACESLQKELGIWKR